MYQLLGDALGISPSVMRNPILDDCVSCRSCIISISSNYFALRVKVGPVYFIFTRMKSMHFNWTSPSFTRYFEKCEEW